MSDYTKSTDFASKDSLPSGDAAKIVKGTEIDTEFNNIAVAVATKADLASPGFSGSPTAPTQSSGDSSTKLATTAFVAAALGALYPVGSIYTNAAVSTNPATLLGFGTWTAFGAGRVLVGVDSSDTAFDTLGETGGSKDAIVVSHTHTGTTNSTSLTGQLSTQGHLNGTGVFSDAGGSKWYGDNIHTYSNNLVNLDASHTHAFTQILQAQAQLTLTCRLTLLFICGDALHECRIGRCWW